MGRHMPSPPSKVPLPMADLDPHLIIHSTLDTHQSAPDSHIVRRLPRECNDSEQASSSSDADDRHKSACQRSKRHPATTYHTLEPLIAE